jgi:Family of unknown function (DUF6931)
MTTQTIQTLRSGQSIAEVLENAEASDEAMALLKPDRAARQYFDVLVKRKLYADAIRFLAHVLPAREAVWWAWSCARDAAGDEPPARVLTSLDTTKRWILEPSDENRRAAFEAGELMDFNGPAGIVALGVFLSGDTMGPPDAPQAPAGPHAAANALAGSICMAAAFKPEGVNERFLAFIARGVERADKGKVWEPEAEAAN